MHKLASTYEGELKQNQTEPDTDAIREQEHVRTRLCFSEHVLINT